MWYTSFFLLITFSRGIAASGFTNPDFGNVEVGKSFNISWDPSTRSPVSLRLLVDSSDKPGVISNNTSSIAVVLSGNEFHWTPSTSLDLDRVYGMLMVDGDGAQQASSAFRLVKRDENSSSTTSTSSTTSRATEADKTPTPTTGLSSSNRISSSPTVTSEAASRLANPSIQSYTTTKVRIAVAVTIVILLIIVVVALIFFEHGKRVASRSQDSESIKSFHRAESGIGSGDSVGDENFQLIKGRKVTELDGVSVSSIGCASCKACSMDIGATDQKRAHSKKVLSMQSVYELG